LVLLAPVAIVAMVSAGGARSRRATANLAVFGVLVAGVALGLVTWAQFGRTQAHVSTYSWINLPLSFSGQQEFQTFALDVSFRVDHAAIAVTAVLLAVLLGVLFWSRPLARQEQSPARLYALLSLAASAGIGVAFSGELVQLLFFWTLTGTATYLLLAHRWGVDALARPARLALVVPAISDLALFAGVGILHSRYGQVDIAKLVPVLHSTVGASPKALAVAVALILAGALGRAAVFPFQAWQTGTILAPPGAVAFTAATWTLLPAMLVYRVLPIVSGANSRVMTGFVAATAIAAAVTALLALVGADMRKVTVAAGAAVAGMALIAVAKAGSAVGITMALAGAPARAAALLAVTAMVIRMRSADLDDMAEGWRRMQLTTLALAFAVAALVAGAVVAGASIRSGNVYWPYAVDCVLVAVAAMRPYLLGAHGRLPRRRAFDPARVREVVALLYVPALLLAVVGLAGAIVIDLPRWLTFVDGGRHAQLAPRALASWLLLGTGGVLFSALLFGGFRARTQGLLRSLGLGLGTGIAIALFALQRFGAAPVAGLAVRSEALADRAAGTGGRGIAEAARAASRAEVAVGAAAMLALLLLAMGLALVTPGVAR
jgi:NADH:ubiquinone oxidoreductase subunit 5 (subunit L)/multisubunit Na+/H+ antiporter MnhA subunit